MSQAYLDLSDEEAVLAQYDALAYRIARAYYSKVSAAYELEELVQQARLGILTAIRTFDAGREVKFITHAYNSARFSVSRFVRKNPGLMRSANPVRDGIPTLLPLFAGIVGDDSMHADVDRSVILETLLECLEPDEKEVCIKMHCHGMSALETARTMGNITAYKVLLLNSSALTKLRARAAQMRVSL